MSPRVDEPPARPPHHLLWDSGRYVESPLPMPGIYRPRHPERTVFYRLLSYNSDRFLSEYERRFEKEYGYFGPVVRRVVESYLDCGNPRAGFARIRCPDYRGELLMTFSCKSRGVCQSCHAKRPEEWRERVWETLLLDVPHHHVVLTVPKTLWIFFKFMGPFTPSHIPDKGQVMARYYGLYDHSPRGRLGRRAVFPSSWGWSRRSRGPFPQSREAASRSYLRAGRIDSIPPALEFLTPTRDPDILLL